MEMSGLPVLLGAMIASRVIRERGYKQLTNEEKVELMDAFSNARMLSLAPLLVLIGGFWLLRSHTSIAPWALNAGYFILLFAYCLGLTWLYNAKVAKLNVSEKFRLNFTLSQVVSGVGVAWFFFTVVSSGRM